jgi:tetratricopeptide (TPR) repeat protein/tRNA A-37 threonylcarbamoyl transferase component Bud32
MTTPDSDNASRAKEVNRIIGQYLSAAEAGRPLDRQELLAQHPDLADDLASFFAAEERLAGPLQDLFPEGATGSAPPAPTAPAPGALLRYLGDYELLEELGRGGMGVVYKARQRSLKRDVAVKTILGGRLASAADVRRFYAEAENVAQLDHPNIVAIYEVAEHRGLHYFSMKLIDGDSLSAKVAQLRHDSKAAARLLAAVARAVHYAHQCGILHRDLKPSNVLVDGAGQPHVTDFGLSKRLESAASTPGLAVVGTPAYMAPEQARGDKGLTTAADVYALGAILYELLTGGPPFAGQTVLDVLCQVQLHEPKPPGALDPKVNRDLETVCLKCLEKDPRRRYPSAEALAEDLERWLRGEPIRSRPAPAWERATKWARRQPALALLVVVGLAALAAGVAAAGLYVRLLAQRRDHAVEKERIAERGRAQALEVIGELLKAARDDLEEVPETEPARRELLERAAALCEKALADRPADPALRLRDAQTWIVLGDLHRRLGDLDGAEQAQGRAIELLTALAREHPAEPDYRAELAAAHQNLGLVRDAQRRFGEAEEHYREALRLLAPGLRPLELDYRAHVRGNLAVHYQSRERLPEARALYEQLIAELESLPAPLAARDRQRLATSLDNLALIHIKARELQPAKDLFDRAFRIRHALVKEAPRDARRRNLLAASWTNLGEWHVAFRAASVNQGRLAVGPWSLVAQAQCQQSLATGPAPYVVVVADAATKALLLPDVPGLCQAEDCLCAARDINLDLARTFHRFPAYKLDLVVNHDNLGELYGRQGRAALAAQSYQAALAVADELARAYPEVSRYQQLLRGTVSHFLDWSVRRGRAPAAAEAVGRVAAAWQKLATERPTDAAVQATRDWLLQQCRRLQAPLGRAGPHGEGGAESGHFVDSPCDRGPGFLQPWRNFHVSKRLDLQQA